ncbi:NADH:ubiquinone oxidoreductase subunit C [Desulfitispora alkaliphila]|uniref:NADH-quinone oxidoreductase subunit C n=1 Tax=Desulfitispora alkaliphila TaxID=622674 RepID=UPI003D21A5BA
MFKLDKVTEITPSEIVPTAKEMEKQGYRFIIITCNNLDDKVELIYNYDKDLEVKSYRTSIAKDEKIPSISSLFISALLIENEIQDLFGVTFSDLVLDYHQKLMTIEDISAPQAVSNMNIQLAEKKAAKKVSE